MTKTCEKCFSVVWNTDGECLKCWQKKPCKMIARLTRLFRQLERLQDDCVKFESTGIEIEGFANDATEAIGEALSSVKWHVAKAEKREATKRAKGPNYDKAGMPAQGKGMALA